MTEHAPVETADEIQRMQDGVRDWVHKAARRGQSGLRTASPAIVLSLLCASAFCPLLMVTGVAGAGLSVLSGRRRIPDPGHLRRARPAAQAKGGQTPSQQDVEKEIAQQIQQALAAGDARANALRGEIASVLKEIDAGGTALRAAMEQSNERVRGEVIAAIGVLGSDFSEMRFLLRMSRRRPRRSRRAWTCRARTSGRSSSRTPGSRPTSGSCGRIWRSSCEEPATMGHSVYRGAMGVRDGSADVRTGGCCRSTRPTRTCSTGGSGWPPNWRKAGRPGEPRRPRYRHRGIGSG